MIIVIISPVQNVSNKQSGVFETLYVHNREWSEEKEKKKDYKTIIKACKVNFRIDMNIWHIISEFLFSISLALIWPHPITCFMQLPTVQSLPLRY